MPTVKLMLNEMQVSSVVATAAVLHRPLALGVSKHCEHRIPMKCGRRLVKIVFLALGLHFVRPTPKNVRKR